jgi:hypothetical protein
MGIVVDNTALVLFLTRNRRGSVASFSSMCLYEAPQLAAARFTFFGLCWSAGAAFANTCAVSPLVGT